MYNWLDIVAQRERYDDLVREAEHDRLVHRLPKRETSDHLYLRLLAWLGCVLIATGKYLQEHYGDAARISEPLASLGR
jgi:hypothetical protein